MQNAKVKMQNEKLKCKITKAKKKILFLFYILVRQPRAVMVQGQLADNSKLLNFNL